MSKGYLLSFSGPDGVGKSTQVRLAIEDLSAQGYTVLRVWTRIGHTALPRFVKNMAKRLRRLKSRSRRQSSSTPSAATVSEPGEEASPSGKGRAARLFLLLGILDLIRVYGWRVRWLRWRGKVVICDRYVGDTALYFDRRFPELNVERWWLWRILVKVAPKPDAAFMLLTSPENALARAMEREKDDEEELRKVEGQVRHYADHASAYPWHVIDAGQSIEDVWAQIEELLPMTLRQRESAGQEEAV